MLEHASWMRHLAISMVGDAQQAEDLAQETWVRALEHPPATDGPLQGWLATVMKNLFRQERRGQIRKADRESEAAVQEEKSGDSGSELLARVSMQRKLVELVMTLDEPYRKVVLLRYFEELVPKRIAEQEKLPISTVKTQLARGIEKLRERLDAEHGSDGKSWVMALLPVLREPAGLGSSASLPLVPIGAFLMNLKVIAAVLALTILGTGYMITRPDAEVVQAEQPIEQVVEAPAETRNPKPELPGEEVAQIETSSRQAVPTTATPSSPEEATAPVAATEELVHGRVLNLSGHPVAGVDVVSGSSTSAELTDTSDALVLATSADDGSFAAPRKGISRLFARDPQFATVLAGVPVTGSASQETVVVVAPRIEVAGQVVDEYGNLIVGAQIELQAPLSMRGRLGVVLDFSQPLDFAVESDSDGRFEFKNAPGFIDGLLIASAEGYSTLEQTAPETSGSNYQLVLHRPALSGDLLTGIVVDELGNPVPGADVSMGIDTTRTDAAGGFTFDLADPESANAQYSNFIEGFSADELIAIKPGFLPGQLSARGKDETGRPIWPDLVMLRISGEPLAIRGRVIDQGGTALANMRVWIADPTFFGRFAQQGGRSDLQHVETMLVGDPSGWNFAITDMDGSFELNGLMSREYAIEAMDPDSLVRTRLVDVAAGSTGVELEISYAETWEVVRGRVVDGRGNPLAQASVRVSCDAFRTQVQGQTVRTQHSQGAQTTTDAEGNFELKVVPKEDAYFRVDHPDAIPVELGRDEQALRRIVGEDFEDFTLVVPRRCHFQITLTEPDLADTFEMLDAEGTVLSVSEFQGNGRREGLRSAIISGQTNLLAVGDNATTLVLYLNGAEVKRMPVVLTPGEQTTLQP